MKPHLPVSLFKALTLALASTVYFSTADAACLHAAVSPTTYTDFGQNMARYSVYQVNDLLSQIRKRDGVQISYTTGTPPANMGEGQPMISFEGVNGDGAFTAVGYNYTATVAHNGCPNPCFTGRYVGDDQAIHYQGVEYRSSQNKVFLLSPSIDYKITRSSKIYTDITASGVFDTTQYLRDGGVVTDLVHYRAGAGTCDQADFEGNTHNLAGGYSYITGGVVATLGFSYMAKSDTYEGYDYRVDYKDGEGPRDVRGIIDDPYTISIRGIQDYGPGGAGQPTPDNPKVYLLPFVSRGGDSGSPVWAWNEKTEAYELISCHQARGGDNSYSRGASEWTMATMEYFNKHVDMDKAGHTVILHAVTISGEHKADNNAETTLQYGTITSEQAGFAEQRFCGVGQKNGETVYTWLSLAAEKNQQNWYRYGDAYFNANGSGKDKAMTLGDLFYTENLVFESNGSDVNHIKLDADIDTGIGYAQFSRKKDATEGQNVKFYLESNGKADGGRDFMLNTSGFITDAGTELHIGITNTQRDASGDFYYREWRKQGDGNMYLESSGNNEIFLNLGGKGTTYLREVGGYAAYNVLINNGATLNFNGDINQIARDVTFGNGGGYLEFSGLTDFYWRSGENQEVEAAGFTINALTQDATLINSTGSTTLHYQNAEHTTFLGSFQDTKDSSLTIINEGGGTWTLNSIHTKLQNENSRFIAASGTTELVGQLTKHGIGSIEGKGGTRYSHPDDWHYSDATMNVEVRDGATFRLGSHARLKGNVDVKSGGTLEIAEGVKHQYEYIEGWLIAEDTTSEFYRDFYGLKGNVNLAGSNSTLRFKFSEGTDAENVYTYNITGAGNVDMQLGGSGATLVLSGANDFTGTKTLAGGGLIAESYSALGNTSNEKWHVKDDAFIAVKGLDGNEALKHIVGDSTGVIALTKEQMEQVNLAGHERMFVGALAGEVIQYGEAPKTAGSRTEYTDVALDTVSLDGSDYWQLGGGGGELVVNFLLDNKDAQLVLGNEYTTGTVTLTNVWNRIGSIFFAGKVTLNYTSEEALGGSKIALDYTNRVAGSPSVVKLLTRHSCGAMMLDGMENDDVDLTDHAELFLGSQGLVEYNGSVIAGGGAYRFGGNTGTLVLNQALTQQEASSPLNLIVDAQTYSGGTLALAAKAGITGDVTVMGHDATRSGFSGGDITLRTDVNDAIASATTVTLKDGGILDVNGTEQILHGFNMEAGSLLTDSSANWNGKVTLDVAGEDISTLAGAVDVNYMVKEGTGMLLLAGDNAYGNLVINNGLVQLQNGNSLSSSGVTIVEDRGVLDLSGNFDVTGTVAFSGGTAKVGAKAINGSIMVGTNGDGTPETGLLLQEKSGASTRINAAVEVAEESTLTMRGQNGTFVLSNTELNESGGTIVLQGKQLTIDRGGSDPVNIGGTISLEGFGLSPSDRVTLFSKGSADNMTRNINELRINTGATISEESWNTVWNIHCLTGEGNLLWNSKTTHWYSARLVLDGANDFSGSLTAQRSGGRENNREYQAYVELAHDQAAQDIDMTINGQASNFMSLAVNTENAEIKSLEGNPYSVLYAGAAQSGTDHDTGTTLHTQPISTRQAYLTITGNDQAVFSGNVDGQDLYEIMRTKDDGTQEKIGEVYNSGISLVMNGSASQTFNGNITRFNDVEANKGHLVLSSENLKVKGDVSVAAGAELEVTRGLTLTADQTLNFYSGDAVSVSNRATFTGDLTLAAGSLVNVGTFAELGGDLAMNGAFMSVSGLAMSHNDATLAITGGVSGSVDFSFTDTSSLVTGKAYYLADSDWSETTVNVDLSDSPYLTYSVSASDQGLYITFQTMDGSFVWDGNQDSHTWDAAHFGQQDIVPEASNTAVFTNAADNTEVVIAASSSVNSMVIDSSKNYLFHSSNRSVVVTDTLVKSGSGKAVLSESVVVGTAEKMGSVEINDGELVVQSANTLAHIQSITGSGTLGISYQNAQESAIFHTDEDYVGALHIENGSYTASEGLYYYDLILGNSSTYTLNAGKTIFGAITVNGNSAALNLQNYTLDADNLILESDVTLMGRNVNKSTGKLSAAVDGVGRTVTTSGELVIGSPHFNANLKVSSGITHLAGGAYSEIGTITLGSAAVLNVDSGASITNLTDIFMGEGSKIVLENGNGGNNSLIANIAMTGRTAQIDGSLYGNGSNVQGSISGNGTLKLGHSSGSNSWRLDSVISNAEEGGALAVEIDSNVTLTGNNSYTGGTTISGSTVQVSHENALAGGALDMTGGTLKLNSNLNLSTLSGAANSTLQLNGKKLILNGTDATFAGTVSSTGSIAMNGSGTQEFSKAASFTDIAVNSGTLQLAGGSSSGKISVEHGASLNIKDNDFTIASAVENSGTFAFSGADHTLILNPAGSFELESLGYRDINGSYESDNGFAQGTTIKVFNNHEGAQVSGISEVSYLGDTLQLDSKTGYAGMGASTSVYTVRKDVVEYNDEFTAHDAASAINVFSLASESSSAPATFKLDKALEGGVTILSAGFGGNVEIAEGATLSQAELDAQVRTTLTGSGIYELNGGTLTLPSNVVLGDKENWTGIVRVSNFAENGVDFSKLANVNSWVEVCGMRSGYLAPWDGGNLATNLILTDNPSMGYAMYMNNGSGRAVHPVMTVSGKWSGDGTVRNGNTGSTLNLDLKFTGDISDWHGKYVQTGSSSVLSFAANDDMEVNASFSMTGGSFSMVADSNVTFKEAIVNPTKFTVNNDKTATLAGNGNVLDEIQVNHGGTLVNAGSTMLGGSVMNLGSIVNSGMLDYGFSEGVDNVTNLQGGQIVINTALTTGNITNSGDIIISSLMQGEGETYVDANGMRGKEANPHDNGFATSSFTVFGDEARIDNQATGRILYCGVDVTKQVIDSKQVVSAANFGTYNINSTDNSVTFSKIYTASGGALEYILFNEGTSLNVDAAEGEHLRTSQVFNLGTATLKMDTGATLVVDESTEAHVQEATAGSTLNFVLEGNSSTCMTLGGLAVNGSTVNVSGSGVLSLGNSTCKIATLNINSGTVYTTLSGGTSFIGRNTININGGGSLQLDNTDAMGYGSGAIARINLQGDDSGKALLELGGRQTYWGTVINMAGNAEIRALATTQTGQQAPMLDPTNNQQSILVANENNLLSVPLRMRNALEINVNAGGELTFDGGVYDQSNHGNKLTKAGEGKLTLTGSGHSYTKSAVDVTGGTLAVETKASFCDLTSSGALVVKSGTTTLSAYTASTTAASVTVDAGATLVIGGAAKLGASIENSGIVNFTAAGTMVTLKDGGSYDVRNAGYLDVATGKFSTTGNGLRSAASVRVVNGGTVAVADNISVLYDGTTYNLRNDGRAYSQEDTENYYVQSGSAAYTAAVAAVDTITTVKLSNSATLNLQTALAEGVQIASTGGTVNIGDGVLLSRDSLTGTSGSTKLAGSGTYALDLTSDSTLGNNVSLDSSWSGVVRLTGTSSDEVNLNSMATLGEGSYASLEMAGATLELQEGEVNPSLLLAAMADDEPALIVMNSGNFTFNGDISGSGSMMNAAEGESTYKFNGGNLSNWSGVLANYEGTLNVAFAAMEDGGTMGATLSGVDSVSYTAQNAGDTYTAASLVTGFNGTTLSSNNGTLKIAELMGFGDLTVNGSVELAGGEYEGSSITVNSDATLHLNGVQARGAVLDGSGTISLEAEQVTVAGVTGSGSIRAAGEGSHTLEIAGEGANTSSAAIGSGVDLVMSGTGSQTFNGDLTHFNGAVDVLRGSLTLGSKVGISALTMNGGAVELAHGSSIAGVRVASGAAASITSQNGGAVALQQAILNSGTLTLAGVFDVSDLAMQHRDNGYIAADGVKTESGSGFATMQNAIEVVRNVVEGSLIATNARVKYGDQEVQLNADGWVRFNAGQGTDFDTYYLRDNKIDGMSVSQIQEAVQGGASLNKIVFDNMELNANLVVDTASSLSLYQVAEDCTANLILTAGGSIDQPSGYRGGYGFVKLAGSGTYYLHDTAQLGKGISLTDSWTGTVALSGAGNTLDLSSRGGLWKQREGSTASTVRLDGWTSALTDTGWETNAHIELGEQGMTVQGSALEGETAPVYAFNGNVSGTGSITNAREGISEFSFADVQGWSGSFVTKAGESILGYTATEVASSIRAAGGNVTAQFKGEGNSVMNGIMKAEEGSMLDVVLLCNTSFKAEADVTALLVNHDIDATIASKFSVQTIESNGRIIVDKGGDLNVANIFSIDSTDQLQVTGGVATFNGDVTIAQGATFKVENGGSLVFNGTVNVIGSEQRDVEPAEGACGYGKVSNVAVVGGGASGANWTLDGHVATYDAATGSVAWDQTSTTFFLSNATAVNISTEVGAGHTIENVVVRDGIGTISLNESASLTGGIQVRDNATAKVSAPGSSLSLHGESTFGANAHVEIEAGSTLGLNHADSAANVIKAATGAGDIVLGVNTTLANGVITAATGKLSLAAGTTLSIGTADGQNNNLSSFSNVVLDGGKIRWQSAGAGTGHTSMNGLTTTEKGGTFQIFDISPNPIVLGGTTTLEGDLTLQNSNWGSGLIIENLTGAGSLDATSTSSTEALTISINAVENYTGGISIVNPKTTLNATMNGGVALSSLTLRGAKANIRGDFSTNALHGSNGVSLHVDSITINTAANTESSFAGALAVAGKLVKDGEGSLTLTVGSEESPFQMNDVYDLNGGTLVLSGNFALNQDAFIPAGTTYVDTAGEEHAMGDGSGYQIAKGDVTVVKVAEGANLNVEHASFLYKGENVQVNNQGIFSWPQEDTSYSSYYVFTDDVSLSDVQAKSTGKGEPLTDLYLQESGSLTVQQGDEKLATLHVKHTSKPGDVADLIGNASVGNVTGNGILSVNGTLNADSVTVSPVDTLTFAGSGTATIGVLSNEGTGALVFETANVTLSSGSSYSGDITINAGTVKMGNVQSLGAYNRVTSIDATPLRSITVGEQGVLDVNGGETGSDVGYTVTLDGGTLTNTGGDKNYGKRQPVTNLILDSDSKVAAQKTFGLVASSHAATTLALNGHTLEKTGGNAFYIVNATVDAGDGGRIKVSEGMLNFNGTETGKRGTMEGTLELAGGNVAGHIKLGGDAAFDGTAANSDVTADIDTNGHDVRFAGSGDISVHAHSNTGENGSGAISGSGTIVKEGAGTTAISGSMANFSGSIDAQGGVLDMLKQGSLSVRDVTIANGATVGAYTTAEADEMHEATLTISGTLAAKGANGKLNANVVMEIGSTLDASATGGNGIALGSSLTIQGNLHLSDADFAAVAGLGYGERYVLFNGVDSLTLDQTYSEAITPEMQLDAAGWFKGLDPEQYYVVYDGSNVGQVAIFSAVAPEPTTSTLSLLALAALAARRRRKN